MCRSYWFILIEDQTIKADTLYVGILIKWCVVISNNNKIDTLYYVFYRTDDLKDGTLKGTDKFGNKYYENDRYFYGKFLKNKYYFR